MQIEWLRKHLFFFAGFSKRTFRLRENYFALYMNWAFLVYKHTHLCTLCGKGGRCVFADAYRVAAVCV